MSNFAHANKGTTYMANHYLATNILGYGVMVTLQILVLSFLVRVRVSQLSKAYSLRIGFFRILPYPTFFGSTLHCTHKKQTRVFRGSPDKPGGIKHIAL